MDKADIQKAEKYYVRHLKEVILPFWIPDCIDRKFGGYLNCYDNTGKELLSYNKFTWSQGRFLWVFSELSMCEDSVVTKEEKEVFLEYAKIGVDFLSEHVFLNESKVCTYLMDREGNPIPADESGILSSSIYADFFVAAGFAKYADAAKDYKIFELAEKMYQSIRKRIEQGTYLTLPYPIPEGLRMHGIPMIFLNLSTEMYVSTVGLGLKNDVYSRDMQMFYTDILTNFVDQKHVLREMITTDNCQVDNYFGEYCNPGHTMEDIWFILKAAHYLGDRSVLPLCTEILKNVYKIGWDKDYGGFRLFVHHDGGVPHGKSAGLEKEPMFRQIEENHNNKLWWPHSEALYSFLLAYFQSGDEELLAIYREVFDYTFKLFPNPDSSVGEWIQIRQRDGRPDDKVVALPVKDPYHITRNLILIIQLLNEQAHKADFEGEEENFADKKIR